LGQKKERTRKKGEEKILKKSSIFKEKSETAPRPHDLSGKDDALFSLFGFQSLDLNTYSLPTAVFRGNLAHPPGEFDYVTWDTRHHVVTTIQPCACIRLK
jgi:hypothetical protein